MNTKMYVGNLPYEVSEEELKEYFATQGEVKDVNVVMDRETGRARGFAFVEMAEVAGMEAAVAELDGKEFGGRNLKVNEARPKENNRGGGGGGYNRDNRGGGGGGYNRDNNRSGGGSRKGGQDNRW